MAGISYYHRQLNQLTKLLLHGILCNTDCGQLLWLNRCLPILCRQTATRAHLQTTQRLATDGVDRSRQTSPAMESSTGSTARQATGARPSQSGYAASGPEAGCLPAGCGQERSTLPGRDSAANTEKRRQNKKKKAGLHRQSRLAADIPSVRSVSDPPAGPCVFGDCARESRLPIHPSVCFEVGRFTITQSSWTAPSQRCSRKWMSGHAAYALVLLRDRGQFATQKLHPSGEPLPPSQGESPFPLDCYLSWTSPQRVWLRVGDLCSLRERWNACLGNCRDEPIPFAGYRLNEGRVFRIIFQP
jgi:hypothetical protein